MVRTYTGLLPRDRELLTVTGKRAAMGIGVGEEELDDEVAEKIAGRLLLRLVPAES
jgi:hypothetical protein